MGTMDIHAQVTAHLCVILVKQLVQEDLTQMDVSNRILAPSQVSNLYNAF